MALTTSARNRLPGVITGIKLGDVVAQVEIRVGDNHIVSIITREAVDEMGLQTGDQVFAIVKATEVMVGKAGHEDSAV